MPQSAVNGLLLPIGSTVGECGTRTICGEVFCNQDDCCDDTPLRVPNRNCDLEEYLQQIMLEADQVPRSVAEAYFIQAARTFAFDSKRMIRDVVFQVKTGDREFQFQGYPDEEPAGILAICLNGDCIDIGNSISCQTNGHQINYRMGPNNKSIVLNLCGSYCGCNSGQLRVTYFSKPTSKACLFDCTMAQHADAIVALTLQRLLAMPKKKWSASDRVVYYRNEYAQALGRSKMETFFAGSTSHISLDKQDNLHHQRPTAQEQRIMKLDGESC